MEQEKNRGGMYLFDSKIDPGVADELDDGSARMDVRLAPQGKGFTNGGDSFDLSAKEVVQAIQNFKKRGGPIAVTIGHFDETERQKQPAAAWIEKLFSQKVGSKTYLMATMRFLRQTWLKIKADQFKFLSMEFWPDDTNQKGEEIGLNVDGAAILNYPFFPLRFDQNKGGGAFVSLSQFAPSPEREKTMNLKKKLQAGQNGIEEIEGQFCIIDAAGTSVACFATREEAEAGLAELVGGGKGAAKLAEVREVEGKFCVFNDAGDQGECFETREEAEAAMGGGSATKLAEVREVDGQFCIFSDEGEQGQCFPTAAEAEAAMAAAQATRKRGASGETVTITKAEHARLRTKAGEVKATKQGSRMMTLEKDVRKLKAEKDMMRLQACVRKLREEMNVHIPGLAEFNLETPEGCHLFLAARIYGIPDVLGWEKVAGDLESAAHLPRMNLGRKAAGGKSGVGSVEPDLASEGGRAEAVRRKVADLRKDPGMMQALMKRHQTVEDFAKEELSIDNPGVKFKS